MAEDIYWKKYASRFRAFPPLIQNQEKSSTEVIICIPAYAEPSLNDTLDSLLKCIPVDASTEVLILFNEDDRMSETDREIHIRSFRDCQEWISQHRHAWFNVIPVWLQRKEDVKKWGVGWARKLLMDEAARRLGHEGIIISLDADCQVESNYVQCIHEYFLTHPGMQAASIYVEHKTEGISEDEKKDIIDYELHLRYLVHAKRWAGHPFAYPTYGSGMAVRRQAYLEQGGMNTRQAGEDFYFLQKFIELGSLQEINDTTVFASTRTSLRVPFGTGRAMHDLKTVKSEWKTTDFEIFRMIRPFLMHLESFRNWLIQSNPHDRDISWFREMGLSSEVIRHFQQIDLIGQSLSIVRQTTNEENFKKRFFRMFNAFSMIRYMHDLADHGFPDILVEEAANMLLKNPGLDDLGKINAESCLHRFRRLDKGSSG